MIVMLEPLRCWLGVLNHAVGNRLTVFVDESDWLCLHVFRHLHKIIGVVALLLLLLALL